MTESRKKFDAWNPGLSSDIPSRLLPSATIFRTENSHVGYVEAREAGKFCGLEPGDMIAFRVERLIVHEVLIRVTADLSVPDGPSYEELGINLRAMAAQILDRHIEPELDSIRSKFQALRSEADLKIREILSRDLFPAAPVDQAPEPGLLHRLFRRPTADVAPAELPEIAALSNWQQCLRDAQGSLERATLESLITVVGGIVGQRGRLIGDLDLIIAFALNMVCNGYGSRAVGNWLDPIIARAVEIENYRFLPAQSHPFFMNVKGASAAGKSTIRPAQRLLAQKLNIPWEDFALISPDYWRKFLLDYESMGEDYKFAAMLTGQELEIIDKKLDRYMEDKAARNAMSHLLIDRFRFDSFDVAKDGGKNSQLLTRFGDTVFFFFIITPPAATVERAWKRGNETGRYKAVDDLLYHNIEAYSGMPNLFFSTISSTDKKIHFEFLDNSVPLGARPKTVAYGWNGAMTILDLKGLSDIDRFQNVNINATCPDEVLKSDVPPSFSFLKNCLNRIAQVTLADQQSGRIFGRAQNGAWVFKDPSALGEQGTCLRQATSLAALGWDAFQCPETAEPASLDVVADRHDTLGDWGGSTGQTLG